MMKKTLLSLLALATAMPALAEGDDFGMWYSVEASHRLSNSWSVSAEAELRNRNNMKTLDRWTLGVDVGYKPVRWLKLSAGYTLMDNHNPDKLKLKTDGSTPNKYTPSYWGLRHRTNVSVTGSLDWGRFSFSLRERWQYTYRPKVADKKYDFDNVEWDDVKAKSKHVLRSRLQVEYNIPRCKVDPFVNVEYFDYAGSEHKMRYQVGVEYKWRKQHSFSLAYRYQVVGDEDDDDGDVNSHLIGLSYKYKF